MPDFWLDTSTLIQPYRGPYGFDIVPAFWTFLEEKAREGIIASSVFVYYELLDGDEDELLEWARQQGDIGFFVEPDPLVQIAFREIADYVNESYPHHNASKFLDDADPWLIAHAKSSGGRVVTFEASAPSSRDPKIPDVGARFGVSCLDLWTLLRELGVSFRR